MPWVLLVARHAMVVRESCVEHGASRKKCLLGRFHDLRASWIRLVATDRLVRFASRSSKDVDGNLVKPGTAVRSAHDGFRAWASCTSSMYS